MTKIGARITGKNRCSEVWLDRELDGFYKGLRAEDPFKKAITRGIETLKRDYLAGKSVRKTQIPEYYKRKYQVNNLYVLRLDKGQRLIYTIIGTHDKKTVAILEAFTFHKEYDRRFGY